MKSFFISTNVFKHFEISNEKYELLCRLYGYYGDNVHGILDCVKGVDFIGVVLQSIWVNMMEKISLAIWVAQRVV